MMLLVGVYQSKFGLKFLILVIVLRIQVKAGESKLCPDNCLCSDEPSLVTCSRIGAEELKSFADRAKGLEELYVRNSNVRYIKKKTLLGLSSLKELKITASRLRGVEPNALQHFRELAGLDLSSNNIDIIGIPESYFDKRFNYAVTFLPNFITSKNLRSVDLSRNNIKYVSAEELYGMKFVQRLNLSRNNIPEIRSSYRYLMGVKVLDLSYNRISDIDENFGTLQMILEEIYISHNYIQKLPEFSVPSCANMKVLDLSFNEISSIAQAGIENCFGLKTLSLESNKLTSIKVDDFRKNKELWFLNLANNSLSEIPDSIFTSNSKLQMLFLQGNNLNHVTNYTLKGLTSVSHVNLAFNDITVVGEGAFSDNAQMEYVFLQNNAISYVFPNTFINLPFLKIVDLRRNRLSTPFSHWFLSRSGPYHFDSGQRKVVQKIQGSNATFFLSENHWSCDCSVRKFFTWAHSQYDVDLKVLPTFFCSSPVFHAGRNLLNMDLLDLRCDLSYYIISFLIFHVQFLFLLFICLFGISWILCKHFLSSKKQVHLL